MWCYAPRTRYLSDPPLLTRELFACELDYFLSPSKDGGLNLLQWISGLGGPWVIKLDEEAKKWWDPIYNRTEQAAEPNAQVDAVIGRSSATVKRLAMIFAILDPGQRLGGRISKPLMHSGVIAATVRAISSATSFPTNTPNKF